MWPSHLIYHMTQNPLFYHVTSHMTWITWPITWYFDLVIWDNKSSVVPTRPAWEYQTQFGNNATLWPDSDTSSTITQCCIEVTTPKCSLHLMILIQHLLAPSSTLEFSHVKPISHLTALTAFQVWVSLPLLLTLWHYHQPQQKVFPSLKLSSPLLHLIPYQCQYWPNPIVWA
jgi:hypothetical protein